MTNKELKLMCLDALDDLKSIGIDLTDNSYEFELNNKLTKACGYCQYLGCQTFKISINPTYVNSVDTDELYDTIIHEFLHSAPNCYNHGKEWLRLADIANKYLLTNVTQYYCGNEYDPYKYGIKCLDCNKIIYRRTRQTPIYKGIKNGTKRCHCNTCWGYNLIAIEL